MTSNEVMYDKFDSMFDIEGLKTDIQTAASSDGDFVDVPFGDYEVKVVKIEMGETGEKSKTPGMPMAKVWFEVVAGDYKGQKIFCNQALTSGFGIHKCNQLLNSFESGVEITFENFKMYTVIMKQVFDAIDGVAEYQLAYGQNNKGYSTYEIVRRFK